MQGKPDFLNGLQDWHIQNRQTIMQQTVKNTQDEYLTVISNTIWPQN